MKTASPEEPAVLQALAQAGAGNECLIVEITPGGAFTSCCAPGASTLPVCSLLLADSHQ